MPTQCPTDRITTAVSGAPGNGRYRRLPHAARRRAAAVTSAVVVAMSALLIPIAPIQTPTAAAAPCPDVEVVFARGTGEPPGVGPTGQAFVDALGARIGGKTLGVYPVNYPASSDWPTGAEGIRDAGVHVVSMAATCPQTKMVLGGYSQGAAVMGFVTSAAVPDGVDPATVPKPLQPEVADNVAAVVLFGKPNARAMNLLGEPQVVIGPLYQEKTIQLCVANDPICSDGLEFAAHDRYIQNGTIDQGAAFAADRLS
ncbi:cutinase [Mycolicibacterium cyprinidarum]|nr:cutinase [Mycolicibacterium sp. NGTWS1803]